MPSVPAPTSADAVLEHIGPGTDLLVPTANGEPVTVLDAIEARSDELEQVRVLQAWALHDRPHHAGAFGDRMRHVSFFLSAAMRKHFEDGTVDLFPCDFGTLPATLRTTLERPLLVFSASPPDRHGYVSLGTAGGYSAALRGEFPVFVEVNAQMPRTGGDNAFHLSDALGWTEADYPLVATPSAEVTDLDRTIAGFVAERIPNGATLQIGVGAVPDAVSGLLADHQDLGIHTELFADGLRHLMESGAVTGARKGLGRYTAVMTDVAGSAELYEFVDDSAALHVWPVDHTNDPRVIATHPDFVAINSTMQVDLLGQCASESLGTHYVSSTGGQADFLRGAILAPRGQSFIVTRSTANTPAGPVSRIVAELAPGAVVTAHKNVTDKVVTEFGVAELRGATISDRARRLIAIAHPDFRDELARNARECGYL